MQMLPPRTVGYVPELAMEPCVRAFQSCLAEHVAGGSRRQGVRRGLVRTQELRLQLPK